MATTKKVGIGDELTHHKFIQALPPEIKPGIVAVKNASLMELGILADEIVPFLKPSTVKNATVPP